MEYNRAQLKQRVRQAMRGQRPRPMLITLLFTIIVSIGSQIVDRILQAASGGNEMSEMYVQLVAQGERDPLSAAQYILMYFGPHRLAMALFVGFVLSALITTLWSGFMRTGYSNFCLGMVRGQQPQTGALFSHFPRWGGVLLTQFLAGLFRTLWELLLGAALVAVIFAAALLFSELEVLLVLVILAAYAAFAVGVLWVTLRYAMVDFLIADRGMTGMDAIRESKRLVRENGNTGRLFVLELSFIGWYLVEFAIVLAACLIGIAIFGAGIGAAQGPDGLVQALAAALLGYFGLVAVAGLVLVIFNLWLTPYITGARALFYDWARGGDLGAPAGGWGRPDLPQPPADYTRPSGPTSGTGIGPAQGGGDGPRPPKDDPWD